MAKKSNCFFKCHICVDHDETTYIKTFISYESCFLEQSTVVFCALFSHAQFLDMLYTFYFLRTKGETKQALIFNPPLRVFLLLLTKRERKLLFRCSNNLSWWKFTLEEILKMLTLARVLEPYPLLFKNFFKHLLFGIIAIVIEKVN